MRWGWLFLVMAGCLAFWSLSVKNRVVAPRAEGERGPGLPAVRPPGQKIVPAREAEKPGAAEPKQGAPVRANEPPARPLPVAVPHPHRKPITTARVAALASSGEVDAFLEDAREENLAPFFTSAILMKNPVFPDRRLDGVEGRYVGKIVFFDDPKKTWDVSMNAKFQIEDGKLRAGVYASVSENGRVRDGYDGLSAGYLNYGDGLGILLKISRRDDLQLFYLPGADAFVGNYYEVVSSDQIVPRGTVRLDRAGDASE